MRVVLVGPSYPYRGGISHFTQMLAREFMREHEVHIVGFSRLYPSLLFPGRTQYDEGGELVRVDAPRLIDSMNPLSFARAGRAIAALNPDLVVFAWWHSFFGPAIRMVADTLRRKSAAPRVFLCHNVLPHESSVADRVLAGIGLASAQACLVQSEADRARLLALRPGMPVAVHPHPVYSQFAGAGPTREEARARLDLTGNVLLFFGLIRPYKGLETLLRAFALLRPRLDATLLVVGEFYEDRRKYDDLLRTLGIEDRVRVVGRYVPDDEVAVYFRAADVAVLPYHEASQSGIVQMAFGFGMPVIVTAVGGLPDVVRDGVTGFVVPPNDPASLADAVVRYFEEGAGPRFSEAIAADVSRFSWRGCAEALIGLGERVKSGSREAGLGR